MAEKRSNRLVNEQTTKVTSVLEQQHEHALVGHDAKFDDSTLAALGYKQEFKRNFSIWSSFGVSFSVLGLLPSIASTLVFSLGYSGTGGAVWGWLVSALIIQATAFSSECSQDHWTQRDRRS